MKFFLRTTMPHNSAFVQCVLTSFLVLLCASGNEVSAQPQVYRDRVEPHWFANQSRLWYRNDLSNEARDFIVVDAIAGTREPAFDHAAVAVQISALLKREVTVAQLPVEKLEWSDDLSTVTLMGKEGTFLWNFASSKLSASESASESETFELFLPARGSAANGEETEIIVVNELDHPVQILWIDATLASKQYATVGAGGTHRQHTFAGHVWLFRNEDGSDVGCVEAGRTPTKVTLNEKTAESVRRSERRRNRPGRGRRNTDQPTNPPSPDGRFSVFIKEHNIWLNTPAEDSEVALSNDANAGNTFRKDASRDRSVGMNYDLPNFPDDIADAHWSADSAHVVAFQTTQVEERRVHYIQSSPADQLQPMLQSYPYLKAGDPLPVTKPRLFRVEDRQEIAISNALFPNPWSLDFLKWHDDDSRFWLLYNERGHQRLRVLEVTATTGDVRAITDEQSNTFIHYSSEGKFELRWLPNNQLLWASERSGWNHLYRYDTLSGQLTNAVTSGDWNVRRIEHIDEEAGVVWFFAVGIKADQDPYHEHFCRVNLDGSGFAVLTEGDGTHTIEWAPDRRWFVDRFSRVDLPVVTELRTASGNPVCKMEAADASEIITERGSLPQRVVAKARDGKTDIWGIVHRPKNFDPAKSYPVIENIYAGPHDHHVPKAFRAGSGHQQRIADQGFIVVQIDGMGTAWRSKAFHDVCYRNLKDAGFPDRIAWMKSLKETLPQIDLSRVGIYGGSAGGQNAMAALLWHGDFYKAAVADCGCHDNRMDKIWWNEQWMGIPDGDVYQRNSNMENAHLLQGRLMLVVGELDRNVDPATSTQVAKKLVDAEKDFDFVVVPGAGHGACETPWASRRRLEFFVSTLLGNYNL